MLNIAFILKREADFTANSEMEREDYFEMGREQREAIAKTDIFTKQKCFSQVSGEIPTEFLNGHSI